MKRKGIEMNWRPRGWALVGMLLAFPGIFWVTVAAVAQIVTTQVTDTIYRADGTPATGTVIVSWPAFTNSAGQAVPAGSTSVVIPAGGLLSVNLAPNAGATPMGTYYTAVFHLDDGTVSREYWVVPASATAVHVSAIESTVMPTSVAMQTVSKTYVDTAIAAAVSGHPLDMSNPYVEKSGDTMTGPLVLPADPVAPLQAADKQYVDENISGVASGLAQKVATLPFSTQTVAQPPGTDLHVNHLNGTEYASQYLSGDGNNGIANAVSGTDCTSGCEVKAEQNYASGEIYVSSKWNDKTHVEDVRKGQRYDGYLNPESVMLPGQETGQVVNVVSTRSGAKVFQETGSQGPSSAGIAIYHSALTGGSNLFPENIESPVPYFKSNYTALSVNGMYNTQGQHVLTPMATHCYGVGDCLIGSQLLTASGGFRDNADEGTHPFDVQVREDTNVFQGTCTGGCAPGSTSVMIAATSAPGTEGDGRFLIDKNPAKVLSAGMLTGVGAAGPHASAAFSGSGFPVSVFFQTAQGLTSQSNDVAPGTVTFAIATSGVPSGYATNTGAAPQNSGVACVTDPTNGYNAQNYEMANYTVVDGTHLQMTLNKAHAQGASLAMGGLCGYGLEQTVDTTAGIRQVFPVVGSYSATGLYYVGGKTPIVGSMGSTSAFANLTFNVASIARSGNVVTVTTAGNLQVDVNGLSLTVSGVADSSYNGAYTVTTTGPNTLTYAQNGPNSTSTGGTLSVVTGGYALYPMAEVLSVFDTATKTVDGQMTLAPNTVAWAANDAVEQPHYYLESVDTDTTFVGQTTPRASVIARAGIQYEGNNGPGLQGWGVTNAVAASNYFGNGGTHSAPDMAYLAKGVWLRTMVADAGEQAVFTIRCNSHGCGKWNSSYNLFELDSSVGTDTIVFQPTTSSLSLNLRGTGYSFTPQGFTAGTVNATTLNGAINAANISSGTLNAARLPVFGASGSGHAVGAVPDPGSTAGTTRYLREDGTWAAPAATVGSTTVSGASLPSGATADYNFLQGSGSVATDMSGNGNDATLGTGTMAPSWTSTGLNFAAGQGVALPAALNGTQTFVLGLYINPLTAGTQPTNVYPVLITSSLASAQGFNLMYDMTDAGGNFLSYTYAPTLFVNAARTTDAPNLLSGFHVLGVVLGTGSGSLDHFYIDGVEVASYRIRGASAGAQTSGNLFLGSSGQSTFAASGLNGAVYRMRTYARQLSATDMATVSMAIRNDVASRGVATSPQQVGFYGPQLHAIGDSITAGLGAPAGWPALLSLANQPAYTVTNWGIAGINLQALNGSEPNRVAERCQTNSGATVTIVFAGTNDFLLGSGSTATGVMGSLMGEVQTLKQAGCKVFVGTMISRGGNDVRGTSFDTDKDAYDGLILSSAKAGGADGVIDFAANPKLGADGANTNMTYFQSDNIHPTQAGQTLLAAAASNALNYAYGYNEANPHNVTALPYSMTAGDGYVSLGGLTSAGTLTLPDCTGQSGATYRIGNPQAAYAVMVAPLNASQLINGLAFGTAVTVPPNGSVTLRDVANPKAVSGCHWEM